MLADLGGLLYRKGRNRWWDGYTNQKFVIMEDADPDNMQHMGGYVKDWMDRAPFKAEVKCGNAYPDYDWFIVTSQYTIDQVFPDKETNEAVKRRCKEITFLSKTLVNPGDEVHHQLPHILDMEDGQRFVTSARAVHPVTGQIEVRLLFEPGKTRP